MGVLLTVLFAAALTTALFLFQFTEFCRSIFELVNL